MREFREMVRRRPYSAVDLGHNDPAHAEGASATFATLEEAIAWLKARGDNGCVRHIGGFGVVYFGTKDPRHGTL
jgi:hypothetical protein